ncbi:MAG: hypothetical protein NTZ17_00830, partial [Phycisphaerae bacterium]|nr:hypothetical protein [Phycisphaerae bacterium]
EFQVWRSGISDADYQVMVDAINAFCDRCAERFVTSWLPGQDSAISDVFPPLTAVCGGSREQSGLFFGNIVWRVVYDRTDEWYFLPADKEGGDPWGMQYWRKGNAD